MEFDCNVTVKEEEEEEEKERNEPLRPSGSMEVEPNEMSVLATENKHSFEMHLIKKEEDDLEYSETLGPRSLQISPCSFGTEIESMHSEEGTSSSQGCAHLDSTSLLSSTQTSEAHSVKMVPPRTSSAFALLTIAYLLKKRQNVTKKKKKPRRVWSKYQSRELQQPVSDNELEGEGVRNIVDDIFTHVPFINKEDFDYLASLIGPIVERMDTIMRKAIPAREKLAITLRYLSEGESYPKLENLFKVSKSSISKMIPEVCAAILNVLSNYIQLPSSSDEWLSKAGEFERELNFPHATAVLDGRHIKIMHNFSRSKSNIILFALVDANSNFLHVEMVSREELSSSDNNLFKNTRLYGTIKSQELHLPFAKALQIPYEMDVPYFIISNQSFGLNDGLMTPFEENDVNRSPKSVFNLRHSQAHKAAENAFNTIGGVFRIFRKPLSVQHDAASKIILCILYLHNFLKLRSSCDVYKTEAESHLNENESFSSFLPLCDITPTNSSQNSIIRQHLAQHFFLNDIPIGEED